LVDNFAGLRLLQTSAFLFFPHATLPAKQIPAFLIGGNQFEFLILGCHGSLRRLARQRKMKVLLKGILGNSDKGTFDPYFLIHGSLRNDR